jgi:fucokinase
MQTLAKPWDYLIITASNEKQASAYESQLYLRRKLGFIPGVKQLLVLSDPGGKRIGSGGSTIFSLLNVLNRELKKNPDDIKRLDNWKKILQKLRILIIHAGGDSRRLPAYGPCGKVFIPVPGESDSILGQTLFDRQLPVYLRLPTTSYGQGQVVVTTGDVFLDFDPEDIHFYEQGITGLFMNKNPKGH